MSFLRARRPPVFLALAGALAIAAAASASTPVSAAIAAALAPVAAPSDGPASAPAAAVPGQDRIPPAPTRWVTDEAGFLSRQAAAELDARLESYERRTGHQVIVWIGRTLGENAALEDWAVKAFEAWKVGRRGLDDGLVLFIFAEDRKIRIEVGYGLEDKVPDIYAFRVIDQILAPGFRAGRVDEAVDAAVTAIMGYISGDDPLPAEGRRDSGRPGSSLASKIFTGLIVLVLLFLFITNPSLAFWLLLNILGGGRGGGRGGGGWGGGGGGGFSGGGGRSGGGGASGGW